MEERELVRGRLSKTDMTSRRSGRVEYKRRRAVPALVTLWSLTSFTTASAPRTTSVSVYDLIPDTRAAIERRAARLACTDKWPRTLSHRYCCRTSLYGNPTDSLHATQQMKPRKEAQRNGSRHRCPGDDISRDQSHLRHFAYCDR